MLPEKGEVDGAFFVDLKANLFSFGPNLPDLTPRASAWPVLALVDPPGRSGRSEGISQCSEAAQHPYSFMIPFSVISRRFVFHQIDRVVKIYEGNAFRQTACIDST